MSKETYERRGTMIYTEGNGKPGSAQCIAECLTPHNADTIVNLLNADYKAERDALAACLRELADAMADTMLAWDVDQRAATAYDKARKRLAALDKETP